MSIVIQDAIMLLGDSITQFAFASEGYAAKLADAYIRKMDVVNRGFSGYNTEWMLSIFEQCFATKREVDQGLAQKVRILVIWLGANDATLPHSAHHVPLARYKANLASLIRAVRSPDSPRYSPETAVVLLTPPPVEPERWARELAVLTETPLAPPDRDFDQAKAYAEAAREVGVREGVPVVDVWTKMWEAAGRDKAKVGQFLADGLHLNAEGYKIVYEALIAIIAKEYPQYHYDNLQTTFVEYSDIFNDPMNYRKLTKKRSAFISEPALKARL